MKQFKITGMSCAACQARVEKAVSSIPGVDSCSVNLLTNSMQVVGLVDDDVIINAVKKAGYGASLKNGKSEKVSNKIEDQETKKLVKRLVLSSAFLLILMYFSMGHMMLKFPVPHIFDKNHVALGILEMLLTIIIMIINHQFFTNGFKNLFRLSPNMDSLIALGSGVSFAYSVYALFAMSEAVRIGNSDLEMKYMNSFYFETAAMILTLITIGKTLESYSKGKTTNALKGLMDLTPKVATILENNVEKIVKIEEVKVGDIFIVRAGEAIPVDGIVTDGNGATDESTLTGESIPVDKLPGSKVIGGTILKSGYFQGIAKKVGEDTTLAQIIRLVDDASSSKAPIAKIADKVSGVFVPFVIGVALITFIVWMCINQNITHSLERAVSVLVISCPCALGLATPVAIMVGNGLGARNGILFKTAESLEITGKATILALDKTGTITNGNPVVTDIIPTDYCDEKMMLEMAYAIESRSEHPLSKAIVNYATSKNISLLAVEDFGTLPGCGVKGLVGDNKIYAGNTNYISTIVDIPNTYQEMIANYANQGKTPLLFAKNDELIGIICVADSVKADSITAIKEIKAMKVRVVMITGDNDLTAKSIAKEVGIDEVYANILPNEKGEVIEKLKQEGRVIMVGDGINDALALTSADIGMAIGAGSDIAIDAADVVLVNSKLSDVGAALRISKASIYNIYENLFWAFFYNILGIPLAAGVYAVLMNWELNPMFGAAAMSLSSFCVVCNALRLNLKKVHKVKKSSLQITNDFSVEGMMCSHCEKRVENLLSSIDGIIKVTANHKKNKVKVIASRKITQLEVEKCLEGSDYKIKNG